jgi:hypothetical protein
VVGEHLEMLVHVLLGDSQPAWVARLWNMLASEEKLEQRDWLGFGYKS